MNMHLFARAGFLRCVLQEPWVNDAVVIGGASAVLSPIIQWGHTILQSKPQVWWYGNVIHRRPPLSNLCSYSIIPLPWLLSLQLHL